MTSFNLDFLKLRTAQIQHEITDSKGRIVYYGGASHFHEWENSLKLKFRINKAQAATGKSEADISLTTALNTIENLRGNVAVHIKGARGAGLDEICQAELPHLELLERVKKFVFPDSEDKKRHKQAVYYMLHKPGGDLVRGPREWPPASDESPYWADFEDFQQLSV